MTSEFYTPDKDKKDPTNQVNTNEQLPYVLFLGDSISQAYTWPVRDILVGEFNVDRPRANCGDTRAGLEHIDEWVGDRQWDIIHFNWGLHDLCYRHPEATTVYGNRDKINGTISVPLEEYRVNLKSLVERMQKSADQLVWASTTFVPPDEAGRYQGDDIKYNEAAAEIMEEYGVPTNDLHSLTASFDPTMFSNPGDVHYSDKGIKIIIEQVAECIRKTFRASVVRV